MKLLYILLLIRSSVAQIDDGRTFSIICASVIGPNSGGVASFARSGKAKLKSGGQRFLPKCEGFFWPKSQIFQPKAGDLRKKMVFAETEGFFWPKSQILTFFSPKNTQLLPPKKIPWGARKKLGGQKRKSGGHCHPCPPAGDAPAR